MSDLLDLYSEIIYLPAVKVICYTCGSHIYNIDRLPMKETCLKAEIFKPARGDIDPPQSGQRICCPLCGGEFLDPDNSLIVENYDLKP